MNIEAAAEIGARSLVGLITREDGGVDGSSGVLVRLGGRDVVFTARHCTEADKTTAPLELGMHYPSLVALPSTPEETVARVHRSDSADVAVIELQTERSRAWAHLKPVPVDDCVAAEDVIACHDIAFFVGFPSSEAKCEPPHPDSKPGDVHICRTAVIVPVSGMVVAADDTILVGHPREAHVQDATPGELSLKGVSGGPLFCVSGGRLLLVGIAISNTNAGQQRFAKIRHAVELLAVHGEDQLRNAALGTLERLTARVSASSAPLPSGA